LPDALGDQFQIGTDLLTPVTRDAATDREDAKKFLGPHTLRVVFQVKKRFMGKWGLLSEPAPAVGEGKVQTDLGVGKGRNVHRDVVFIRTFENATTCGMAGQVSPEQVVYLVT